MEDKDVARKAAIEQAQAEVREQEQRIANMPEAELTLRSMLWRHHGCNESDLYGDDGELQCHNIQRHGMFGADFLRDSVDLLYWKLMNDTGKALIPRPEK